MQKTLLQDVRGWYPVDPDFTDEERADIAELQKEGADLNRAENLAWLSRPGSWQF